MTTVYLMRHGAILNPEGVCYGPEKPIAERGRRQMEHIAMDMRAKGVAPAAIIHSPLLRTTQSAEILAAGLNVTDVIPDERLVEWKIGPWVNKLIVDFFAYIHFNEKPLVSHRDDVESYEHLAARVEAVVMDAVKRYPGQSVIVVSHEYPLDAAIAHLQGESWDWMHDHPLHPSAAWEAVFDDEGKLVRVALAFDRHEDV